MYGLGLGPGLGVQGQDVERRSTCGGAFSKFIQS